MTGRPRSVSDETIFRAVAETIGDSGPTGLTLAAVARRAGLTAPALAQRFGSKRGLLLAFAEGESGNAARIFGEARAASPGPVEAIHLALASLTSAITTREALAHSLAFLQLDLADPDLRAHAQAQSRAVRAELTALVEEAVDLGDLTVDDPATVAETLYVVYSGALITWAVESAGPLPAWLSLHVDRALAPHRPAQP
ncbi:TetR/AcrR family transcriptional regulator [Actinocorallia sp. A-T 12471]|uniref:TetR/AcrR family transcriptional regulator n=1 Tax=Actinocorallia sp. A-T 12471 TaxID=3089813 RepID=UPI0029CC372D|nr:TetR/AcrR family transcriptional regulator [Actinocorallia sp. A-T 12471]MDX6740680.1 TetR/AcrR family transcriptional regulator [Actinocorallia sp. A-T 12471]